MRIIDLSGLPKEAVVNWEGWFSSRNPGDWYPVRVRVKTAAGYDERPLLADSEAETGLCWYRKGFRFRITDGFIGMSLGGQDYKYLLDHWFGVTKTGRPRMHPGEVLWRGAGVEKKRGIKYRIERRRWSDLPVESAVPYTEAEWQERQEEIAAREAAAVGRA